MVENCLAVGLQSSWFGRNDRQATGVNVLFPCTLWHLDMNTFDVTIMQAGVLFTTERLRSIDARITRLKAQYEDVQR